MNVLLINGSPHERGSTYRSLLEVAKGLEARGIEWKIVHIGLNVHTGCIGCGGCTKTHRCAACRDDAVNAVMEDIEHADGYVFGSPVHYANMSGNLKSFMDRLFMANGSAMVHKPAAAIVCARRGGTTAAYESMLKYFGINNMPIVSANYWNQVHGSNAQQVEEDLEGMQTMRVLGENMGWLLQCIEAGGKSGVDAPHGEAKVRTNFVR